jgi:hypothetical protein
MEEARTGLDIIKGVSSYTVNYLSEVGNVHKLVSSHRKLKTSKVLITPIWDKNKKPN